MKKIILLLAAMLAFWVNANAQIQFEQLINSIDWNSTEQDILRRFPNDIKQRKHFYSKYNKTITDYELDNIVLGEFKCKASICVDSVSRKLHSFIFKFNEIEKTKDAKTLSKEMDNILIHLFGNPDKRKDDWSDKTMSDIDRTWYKDKYIVKVLHMVFSDRHLYSLVVEGVQDTGNDFRVAKWGDSKDSIIQKEGKENLSTHERIYLFKDFVAGMNCDVAYIFTDNKLTMAKYIFVQEHTNKNDYISDYKNLVGLMTEKYGKPKYDTPEWRNSLYKNEPEDYGFAISLGHLSYNAGWFEKTTTITVALYGENNEITLMIQYESEKYKELKKKQDIQEKTKGL